MTRHHPLWLRKFLAISSAACMTMLALSACGTGSSASSGAPITIGVSISTSGDFSADGTALQQGYQLWADGVNAHGGLLGRKVKLDIVGDNSTPTQVTTNYQKLITLDKVDLVVGPFSSELTGPAALVANRYGYVLIEGSGGAPAIFAAGLTNVFDVSSPVEDNLVSFTTFLKGLPAGAQPLTVAYMTADDPFTQPQIAKAKQILEAAGFKTVYYQVYPTETADFTPIAQGVINSHADIVIGGTGVPDSEAFVTAFKQQHFNPKALIFTSGPDSGATFAQAVGSANTEGILFPNGWWPGLNTSLNTAFTQAFVAKYGGNANDISADSVEAYSVGEVLQQAVTDCHCTDSKTIEQTLHTKSFTTAQGPVQFDAVGENPALPVLLFQWQHGTVVSVYPTSAATASMEYPKPAWGS